MRLTVQRRGSTDSFSPRPPPLGRYDSVKRGNARKIPEGGTTELLNVSNGGRSFQTCTYSLCFLRFYATRQIKRGN